MPKKVDRAERNKSFLYLLKREIASVFSSIGSGDIDLEEFGRIAKKLAKKSKEKWIAPRLVANYLRNKKGWTINENAGLLCAILLQELYPKEFRTVFGESVRYAGRLISMEDNDCC